MVLALAVLSVAAAKSPGTTGTSSLWFVGLLVVFGAALTLIAVVYRWLGLANAGEAFALPTGSIRTLLAIGIMVLFTVFGLNFFDSSSAAATQMHPSEKAFSAVEALPQDVDNEVRRYEAKGFAVAVEARGTPATASAPAVMARLKLHSVEVVRATDIIDMQKQMLTAVVTLLTTVIGFYFGSRSAEGARDKPESVVDPSDADAEKVSNEVKSLDTDIAEGRQRLEALKSELVRPGISAALAPKLSSLLPQADKLALDSKALLADLAGARQQRKPLMALQARLVELRKSTASFKDGLAEAERLAAEG
jgi:hypothetical protein